MADATARILLGQQELTDRQLNAIPLLLQGLGDTDVAAQIGVDRATVYRWRKDRLFIRELEQQRRLLWRQSATRLQSMFEPALDIIQRQISGDDPKTALRAAILLLRLATPARLSHLTEPPQSNKSEEERIDRLLEAYVNAPIPGAPAHHPLSTGLD